MECFTEKSGEEGRIEGAIMMGRMWMIPKEAKKPEDPRKAKKNI